MIRLRNIAANLHEFRLSDNVSIYFSYETPLALVGPGIGLVVSANCVARSYTSNQHLSKLGFGDAAKSRPRVTNALFTKLCDCAMSQPSNVSFEDAAREFLAVWNEGHGRHVG
jgi:hypothetical protein